MNLSIKLLFYLAILVLLFVAFYQLFRSIVLKEKIKQNMDRVYTKLADKDKKRISDIEKERREYGTVGGKNGNTMNKMLDKVDNLLIYSEASVRHPWLNTSTFIVLEVLGFCLTFLFILLFVGNMVGAILLSFVAVCIPFVVMSVKADSAYKSTEKQMTLCVNIVSNMSMSTSNIVTVIKEVAPYMAYPLAGAMQRAVSAANLTGDDSECIRKLSREIEHPMFVRFIRHLEICAKNDSDFKSVAKDYSDQVDTALKNSRRMKAIFDNGKANILTLIGVSVVMICMMAGYTDDNGGVIGMLVSMSHDLFGAVVLIFTGIIYLCAFLYMMLGMRR